MDTGRINPIFNHTIFQPPNTYSISNLFSQSSPISDLRQQYSQLQKDKMQERLKVETEALIEQQQKFALRQQLNPPVARDRDPSIYASGLNLEQYRSVSVSDSASSSSTMPLRIITNHQQQQQSQMTQPHQTLANENNANQQPQPQHPFGTYTNQGLSFHISIFNCIVLSLYVTLCTIYYIRTRCIEYTW